MLKTFTLTFFLRMLAWIAIGVSLRDTATIGIICVFSSIFLLDVLARYPANNNSTTDTKEKEK